MGTMEPKVTLSTLSIMGKAKKNPLVPILILALVLRIGYVFFRYPLWWDSHVYINIGKYIFSGGMLGLWESFRPLLHPLLLGAVWKLGLSPFIVGKFFDVLFCVLAVYVLYLVAYPLFGRKIAAGSALLFSLTPVFIILAGMILADPLALLLGLLGIYVLLGDIFSLQQCHPARLFFGGLLLGLSFMTRFPYGIWFGGVFLAYLFAREGWELKLKRLLLLTGGFVIPVIPYLVLNLRLYDNLFLPFVVGNEVVGTATWMYGSGVWFYFISFFLVNSAYLFFFWYLFTFIRRGLWDEPGKLVVVLVPVLTILYFLTVPRKEVRYMVVALPFLAMGAVAGISAVMRVIQRQERPVLTRKGMLTIVCILVLLPLPTAVYIERAPTFTQELEQVMRDYNVSGPLLVSDPSFVSSFDRRIITLDGMEYAPTIYEQQRRVYGLLFVNDCDLLCAPGDGACEAKRRALLGTMALENKEIFRKSFYFLVGKRTCNYTMYVPKDIARGILK